MTAQRWWFCCGSSACLFCFYVRVWYICLMLAWWPPHVERVLIWFSTRIVFCAVSICFCSILIWCRHLICQFLIIVLSRLLCPGKQHLFRIYKSRSSNVKLRCFTYLRILVCLVFGLNNLPDFGFLVFYFLFDDRLNITIIKKQHQPMGPL